MIKYNLERLTEDVQMHALRYLDLVELGRFSQVCKQLNAVAHYCLFCIGVEEIRLNEADYERDYPYLRDRLTLAHNNRYTFSFFITEMPTPYAIRQRYQLPPHILKPKPLSKILCPRAPTDTHAAFNLGNFKIIHLFDLRTSCLTSFKPAPFNSHPECCSNTIAVDTSQTLPPTNMALEEETNTMALFFPRQITIVSRHLYYPEQQANHTFMEPCALGKNWAACTAQTWPSERRILVYDLTTGKNSNISCEEVIFNLQITQDHLVGNNNSQAFIWNLKTLERTKLLHASGALSNGDTRYKVLPGVDLNTPIAHSDIGVHSDTNGRVAVFSTSLVKLYQIADKVICTHELRLNPLHWDRFPSNITFFYPFVGLAKKYDTHMDARVLDVESGSVIGPGLRFPRVMQGFRFGPMGCSGFGLHQHQMYYSWDFRP